MPGQVPLSNAKFINSPDFNNQAIQGITGSGVFRQFNYLNTGSTRVITSSDVWTIIELTGNSVVTVPSGISANVGDEILFVNSTGIISFSGNILYADLYATPPRRPARLVYAGSNYWILAGDKRSFTSTPLFDCCGNSQPNAYTFGSFASGSAYSNSYGTGLYDVEAVGGLVTQGNPAEAYTIVNGVVTSTSCTYEVFQYGYSFYGSDGSPYTFYSYRDIDITNPSAAIGLPFRTVNTGEAYPCDTSAINGTYYRSYDGYGTSNPVCFSNGVIISATDCSV